MAQLGARFHGMEEVVGSIPTRSTIPPPLDQVNLSGAVERRSLYFTPRRNTLVPCKASLRVGTV